MKNAVYVEGTSELLFVADVLQKYSNYDPLQCGFICINLRRDDFEKMTFPRQGDEHSRDYYQIVNVNNDNLVVSKLRKDVPGLINLGYNVIIGLRDVYGDVYNDLTGGRRVIDDTQIKTMHDAQVNSIGDTSGTTRLHFAIMEYEAWMLALIENYVVNQGQDVAALYSRMGISTNMDPEREVYHPYPLVREIYKACGGDYHKHGGELFSFLSTLSQADYERLRQSGKCASFSKFMDDLLGGTVRKLP